MLSTKRPGSISLAIAAAIALIPLAGSAQTATNKEAGKGAATELFPDKVIAKGKGLEIKRSQLDEALISIKSSQSGNIPPEQLGMLEQQVLDQLVTLQLLLSKATDADRQAGKELATKRLANVKERAGSEENLARQLKSVGLSVERLQQKLAEEATAESVLLRELKVNITDEDVKKFYEENPTRFEQPEMVRASHVLISTKDSKTGEDLSETAKKEKLKLAQSIVEKARKGEDFAKLAKEYSEDPGSKEKGGEYTFPRGQMVPEFESAAFTLKTNQVSDVVTTQFGYHIIKLSEKIAAQKIELTKVSEQVRDHLKRQELGKNAPDFLEKLKKDSNLEILDEKLKKQDAFELPAGHPPIDGAAKEPSKSDKK